MADQAKITSLDALEILRSRLLVFLTKANRSLDDTGGEVHRTREWLQHEQRMRWEAEIRQRAKKLAQAEQELLSAKLAGHREALVNRQAIVQRAKIALAEAQEKLRAVKQWAVRFDSVAEPIVQRLDDLRQFLQLDLPKAAALLANIQKTLEAYTEAPAAPASPAPATAAPVPPETPLPEPLP
ncbi:MAG: hypothetical protein WCH57_03350 [Verrucomicrobiota bacterium]